MDRRTPASASAAISLALSRTSARWARLAKAPMPVVSRRGSPTRFAASRAAIASRLSVGNAPREPKCGGWPCISGRPSPSSRARLLRRTTSNSGLSGAASGPSTEALSESCSATKRTELSSRLDLARSSAAVAADPVKETTSWVPSWSSRSPVGPDDELQRPFRQDPGPDNEPNSGLGHPGGGGGRLHDGGDAGEQRRRQLFQHAPDGEIERVDVNRDALQRRADVLADERAALRQTLDRRHRSEARRSAVRACPCEA